jgi:hypothetical protein
LLDGWIPPTPTATTRRGIIRELVTDRAQTADVWDDLRDEGRNHSCRDVIKGVWGHFVADDPDEM